MPSIGPTIGVKGEKEYKAALRRISMETKQLNTEMELMKARFKATDTQMERNRAMSESLTKQMDKQREAVEKASALLEKAKKNQEDLLTTQADLIKKQQEGIKSYTDEKGAVHNVNEELKDNKIALERSGIVVADYAQKVAAAELEQERLNKELQDTPSFAERAGQGLQNIGSVVEGVGDKLTQYISAPLAALGAFSIKGASDIEDGLAKIYTIADQSVVPMDEMRQGLMELSDESARSVTEIEEAAYQALSASITTEDTVGFVKDASNLARVGFLSVADSVDVLTTIINAYGRDAADAEKISSVLVKTQDDGKTTVNELAQSMGIVIPTAAAYGVSLEQLSTAYVLMTKQGINTARSTTAISAMFTELEKDGSDVNNILVDITDKTFAQLMADGKSVGDVMQILKDSVDGDDEAFARLWGNIRAGRGALALANMGAEKFNEELHTLENISGRVERNLGILETPSLKAQRAFNKLKNSSYDLGHEALEMLLPYLEKGVELVDQFTQWLKSLSKEEKENIIKTAAMAAAMGPLLKVGGKLITGVGKFTENLGAMNRIYRNSASRSEALAAIIGNEKLGWSALTSTIGAAVAAYAALGIAAQYESQKHRNQLNELYGLNEEQKQLIETSHVLTGAWRDTKNASGENAQAVEDQYKQVEILKDKYNLLIDENGKVKDGQQTLATTIKLELAEALGIEYDQIDDLIEQNGKFGQSIDDVIKKMKNEALMASYKDQYMTALTERETAQKNIIDLTSQLTTKETAATKAAEATAEAYEKYAKSTNETYEARQQYYQEYLDAIVAENSAKNAVEDTRKALQEQQIVYNDMGNTVTNYENAMKAIEEGSEHASAEVKKLADSFVTAEHGTLESLTNQKKNLGKQIDTMRKMIKDGAQGASVEALHELEYLYSEADKELNDYLGNGMQKNKQKTAEEMRKFMKEGVQRPAEEGMQPVPDTADRGIMGFVEKLKAGWRPANSAMAYILDKVIEVAGSRYKDMEHIGWYYGEGFARGLNGYKIQDVVREWAGHVPTQTRATLSESSPSKLSQEYGWYWGEGLAIGMNKSLGIVTNAAEQLGYAAQSTDDALNYSGMSPYALGGGMATASKSISAPISVNVTVNGNVDNYDELAETIADKINEQIIRNNEVFA